MKSKRRIQSHTTRRVHTKRGEDDGCEDEDDDVRKEMQTRVKDNTS